MEQFKRTVYILILAVIGGMFFGTWALLYNFSLDRLYSAFIWAGIGVIVATIGIGLYWNYQVRKGSTEFAARTKIPAIFFAFLILGAVAIPGVGLLTGFLTLAPPGEEPPISQAGVNATTFVTNTDNINITGFCEVQLWQTYNRTNSSTWSQVNIVGNWGSTEFYHNGWLNAYFFNRNLTGVDTLGRVVAYYLKVRPWWLHHEWMIGTYTPPSWWIWSHLAITPNPNATDPYIEENETSFTQIRIANGVNSITLVGEPYKTYLKMEDTNTLQDWDSSDGAYSNNLTANYHIRINVPLNESRRGYNTQYDWHSGQYYGIWLIASSDDLDNIYHFYTDIFGNDKLTWFTITQGFEYKGVIFNNTLTAWGTYDVAILLEGFTGNTDFYADIKIWNGVSGINWFLGKGFENNIQIVATL
jgi:hypothetical protein